METAEGASPLMSACHAGQLKIVKKLLGQCNVKETDLSGRTALHYCIEDTDTRCAQALLTKDASLINMQDNSGYTALHQAVIGGNSVMVLFLLDNGANVNSTDNEKHNCVHWATVCGQLEIFDLLLKKKASVSTSDVHGAFPLHYAAQLCGTSDTDQQTDPATGLKILKKILSKGVPVDSEDVDGRQPLLWAASAGSANACEALVKAGAKVDVTDKDGLTALHCSASRGHSETLESLVLQCHLEVDVVDKNKCTALFYAITMGQLECARTLLDLGTNADHRDRKGRSPAHCAGSKGNISALVLLKERKGDIWLRNNSGDFPIHEAALNKHNDMVRKMLASGSSVNKVVNASNHDRRTCLHIAATTGNLSLCKILVNAGAKINPLMLSRNNYLTPYDTAVVRKHEDCAEYLRRVGGTTATKVTNYSASVIQRYVKNYSNKKKALAEAPEEMEVLSEGENVEEEEEEEEEVVNIIPEIRVETPDPPIHESVQTSPVTFLNEVDPMTPRSNISRLSYSSDIVSKVQLSVLKYEVPRRLAREMQAIKKHMRNSPRKFEKALVHRMNVTEVNLEEVDDLDANVGTSEDHLLDLPSPVVKMEKGRKVENDEETQEKDVLAENRDEYKKQVSKHDEHTNEVKERLEKKMSALVKRTEELFNTVSYEAAKTLTVVREKNRTWEQHISSQRFIPSPTRTRKPMLTQETKRSVEQEKSKTIQTRLRHREYQAKKATECRQKVCKAYGSQYDYIFNDRGSMTSLNSRGSTPRPKTVNTYTTMSAAQLQKARSSKYQMIMTKHGMMRLRQDDPLPAPSWVATFENHSRPRHDLTFLDPETYNDKLVEEKHVFEEIYHKRSHTSYGRSYMYVPLDH